MEILRQLFGTGKDLTIVQMSLRAIAVFLFALVLIRISGRRSFGIRTPLDNIILILLGAILSRAVVGASPFIATIITSAIIVLLHRVLGYLTAQYPSCSRIVEGNKIILFEHGRFIAANMKKALVCEEDVLQGVRESALTDSMDEIERVYIERNGSISAVKKNTGQ